jgi:phenylacetate-CoA ligase
MHETPELSVIAPCLNEAHNLPELVERLQKAFSKEHIKGEIVLVNDGSQDNTGPVITALASQYPNLKPCHHEKNQGVVAAWKTGLTASHGEYICLIDADLQYLPEDVRRLYREIKYTHADMVQGYRSSIGLLRDSQLLLSKGFNFILNTAFGMHQKDNKSGFVLCRREVLDDVLRFRYKYHYFQSFITVAAKTKGYSIREIETLFQSRLLGKSFMSRFPVKVVFFCIHDVIKAFFEYRIFYKPENVLEDFLSRNMPSKYVETLPGWRKWFFNLFTATMPIHHWMISWQAAQYYYELKRSQWLSQLQIKELTNIKLRKLIHHAYHHVAYYREKFDELGITPSDIQSVDDLQKIPFLTKNDVRENLYFNMLSDNHDNEKILRITTSGSTGEPFVCYADKHQLELRWAATQRSMEWTGYRFGDRQARLWHQTIAMSRSQIIRERIDAWFNRRMFIPVFEMSDRNIENTFRKLRSFKPILIDGYAEVFNFLAYYIKNHKIIPVKPKGIVSSAQMLPEPSRRIIEGAFECGVFDKFGSREFSGIAYECEAHDGHHIVSECYVVEILKNGKPVAPGEMGEVVITDLNNYCLPFIRYRLGDLAVAMDNTIQCRCGRGLPRIGNIEGRVQAIIIGSNGEYIPSAFFGHFFKDYDYLMRQYQVIQDEPGKILLKIVKGPRFAEEPFAEILKILHRTLGEETEIKVEFVDKVAMVRTGKQHGSISKLNIDFQKLGDSAPR